MAPVTVLGETFPTKAALMGRLDAVRTSPELPPADAAFALAAALQHPKFATYAPADCRVERIWHPVWKNRCLCICRGQEEPEPFSVSTVAGHWFA